MVLVWMAGKSFLLVQWTQRGSTANPRAQWGLSDDDYDGD